MINQKFDYLYAENGRLKAVVVDNNGEPQVTDVTPDKPYSQSLITDGKGDTLVVSKKGQVMGVREYKFAGDDRHLLNEYHRQLDSLGEWQINFTPDTKHQTYAFDQIGSGNHGIFATDQYYPKSGSYDFRYKSVECGKSDKVKVEFGSYPQADSVVFKDKYGVTYPISLKDNIITFTGVSQADTNYIYAYRGDKKIGKLFLNTYQKKTYKVVFVRVNGAAKKMNAKEITKYLNKVYNQCAVSFEDSIDNISIDDLTSFYHGGSGILTVYNDDQKRVLQAYEKEKKMKDGVFYLFFIDNVTDKKDGSGTPVSGYMPRGYNAGFIYDGGSPHTIAHELGHGVAGLEHVFENSNNSGKTANLMDYSTGEALWHFQWDQIQDPSRVWMKWNKDESEGENVEQMTSNEFIPEDKEGLVYVSEIMKGGYITYTRDEKYLNKYFWDILSIFMQRPCVAEIVSNIPKQNSLVFVSASVKETGDNCGTSDRYVRTELGDYRQILSQLERPVPIEKSVYEKDKDINSLWVFKYGHYVLSLDYPLIKDHIYNKDIINHINDYSFAVVIKIFLPQIYETYNNSTILLRQNNQVIKRYQVNNRKGIVMVAILFTLGHEFFIHYHSINGILNNDFQSFIYDSGPNGGDYDHKNYINGKNLKMNQYIKELKDYFGEHKEYNITPEDVDLVKEIHDFNYQYLRKK